MIGSVHRGLGIGVNAGDVFAGYTIDRLLGSGGMGEVYLAQHPRLPRLEALKILNDDISADAAYRQRFIREADLAAALWHPNIVRINDRGEFNGQLWISMDFVDGTDAASLLRDQYPVGMPAEQVADIVEAIARALDYAHQHHDVLHRDVSPANMLLAGRETGEQRILLGDFGIARNIDDTGGLTATNMMIGTFPYAAPEQLTDEPIDGRADQYALAATAFHLLTGTTLFPHTNPAVVISRHLSAPPPNLADIRPTLKAFDPVFAVALAKDPADRFARCTDFADAFARAVHSIGQSANSVCTMPRPVAVRTPARATSAPANIAKPQRGRRRIFAATATVIALTGLGASDYTTRQARRQPTRRSPGRGSPTCREVGATTRGARTADGTTTARRLATAVPCAGLAACRRCASCVHPGRRVRTGCADPQSTRPAAPATATATATASRPGPNFCQSTFGYSRSHRH